LPDPRRKNRARPGRIARIITWSPFLKDLPHYPVPERH